MDIINAIVKGAITVEAVKKETYATMGSGCCTQQVERLIECLTAPEPRKRRKNKREMSQEIPIIPVYFSFPNSLLPDNFPSHLPNIDLDH